MLRKAGVAFVEHLYDYVERTVLELPRLLVNGGRRGYLIEIEPSVLATLLAATPVECALKDVA